MLGAWGECDGVSACRGGVIALVLTGVTLTNLAAAAETPAPLSFRLDVVPVLNKYGCNSGGCHGKASGQNGFKLSLFGFDPEQDFAAIVQEGLGRRVSQAAPDESMTALKATAQVRTAAGRGSGRFRALSAPAPWIAEGTPWGSDQEPEFVGIEVEPAERSWTRRPSSPCASRPAIPTAARAT